MSVRHSDKPSKGLNVKTILRMTDEEARAWLERVRWPNGTVCPHCGTVGESTKLQSKPGSSTRPGVWKCKVKGCRKQFRVEVGTIFEKSHVPLSTWIAAFFLLCSAKKSMSALQLQRQLGIGSYKTAWFLAHRVRFAMASGPLGELMKGVIEADETFVGGKPRTVPFNGSFTPRWTNDGKRRKSTKQPVALVLERHGRARAEMIRDVKKPEIEKFVRANVDLTKSRLMTDDAAAYVEMGGAFRYGHDSVNHSINEYARGGIHSNTAESFFSLFKRGFHGSFHHLSKVHLQRYLDEFSFRWTHKGENDGERTTRAILQGDGIRLMYRAPKTV
jgi:transposase-like protein